MKQNKTKKAQDAVQSLFSPNSKTDGVDSSASPVGGFPPTTGSTPTSTAPQNLGAPSFSPNVGSGVVSGLSTSLPEVLPTDIVGLLQLQIRLQAETNSLLARICNSRGV